MQSANSSDISEPRPRIDKNIVRLKVIGDGGFPILNKGHARTGIVQFGPVKVGSFAVIRSVLGARRHDPQVAGRRILQMAVVNKMLDFRSLSSVPEFGRIFDYTRFAHDTGKLFKAVKPRGFQIKVDQNNAATFLD